MTQRNLRTPRIASVDGVVALAITMACVLPFNHLLAEVGDPHGKPLTLFDAAFGVFFILGWRSCFNALKLYSRFSTVPSRITAIVKGVVIMTTPVVAYMAAFHHSDLTLRRVITLLLALFAFEVDRIFITSYFLDRFSKQDPRRAMILGSGRRAGKAWREIRTRYHSSMNVIGFIDDRDPSEMAPEIARLHIGSVNQLEEALLRNVVDVLLIAMPIKSCYEQMQQAVEVAESVGINIVYLGDIYRTSNRQGYGSEEMFTELAPEQDHYIMQRLAKRCVDLICAITGLIIMSPVMLMIAIGIKLTSKGPVLFSQPRYGHRRRLFTIQKFRSMVEDAEAALPDYEHINEADGPHFKIKNDPRVTRFGQFLRSTSLDELPQLWNVLRGEMSMVGPRPMSVRDVSLFSDATLMRRFSVQAGITGLWQVSGRSETGFEEWMALDVQYVQNWSLAMDLRILFRTVGAVLMRSGAM
jgi:exopolysaccharide biosynthesis polyprenyl glycosylphosphotransferase